MIQFLPFINTFLSLVGLALIWEVLGRGRDTLPLRIVFLAYFAVVLQYNSERLWTFPNYFLIASAGLSLLLWNLKRLPEPDPESGNIE